MNRNHTALALVLALAILIESSQMAHAYLDPGTGSFVLQMLIGGIAGGMVVLKMYWAKTKMFFTGRKVAKPSVQD